MQIANSGKVSFWRRWMIWGGIGLLALVLGTIVALIVVLKIGVSSSFLAEKIQQSLNERLGDKLQLEVTNAYLLLDEHFHLNLESRDVALEIKGGIIDIDKIDRIRIAVAAWPLLQGEIHVRQVQVRGISVTSAGGQGGDFLAKLPQDGVGRIDFDALSQLIFDGFEKTMQALSRQNVSKISIDDIRVHFPFRGKPRQFEIAQLELVHSNRARTVQLEGLLRLDGQDVQLEGTAEAADGTDKRHFQLHVSQVPLNLGVEEGALPYWEDGTVKNGHFRLTGLSDIELVGERAGDAQKIRVHAGLSQGEVELAEVTGLPAGADIVLEYQLGDGKIHILASQIAVDRVSVSGLHGFFGAMTLPDRVENQEIEALSSDRERIDLLTAAADIEGKYSFELWVDEGTVLHPELDELDFSAHMKGSLASLSRQVMFDEIGLQAETGLDVKAQGRLRFAPPEEGRLFIGSQTPEAILNIETSAISAREIKQLWPFNVASAARRWVLRQIEDGVLRGGKLQLNLPLDFYVKGKPRYPLTAQEVTISGEIEKAQTLLIGDLPPLTNFSGQFELRGQELFLSKGQGSVFVEGKSPLWVRDGLVEITRPIGALAMADISFHLEGEGADMLRLIQREPIKAGEKLPFTPAGFSGQVQAQMRLQFPLIEGGEEKLSPEQIDWQTQIEFDNVALKLGLGTGSEASGQVSEAQGQAEISRETFTLTAQAKLDGMPTTIEMAGETAKPQARDEKITLVFDNEARQKLLPALSDFVSGTAQIEIGAEKEGARPFSVDLTQAVVEVPWLGWKKGVGIKAQAQFNAHIDKENTKNIAIRDFALQGDTFSLKGEMDIRDGSLAAAHFHRALLNRGDDINLTLEHGVAGYYVKVRGRQFDMRSFIKSANMAGAQQGKSEAVTLELDIGRVSGFYGEYFDKFSARFKRNRAGGEAVQISALSRHGREVKASLERQGKKGQAHLVSGDGGALLRFADYYDKVQGGLLELNMQINESGAWYGPLSLSNFEIVDEARLARIVAHPPPTGGKSLNDVTGGKINASRLKFDRAFGQIVRGENFLLLDRGIVRGPTVGATFQGIVYDAGGNVSLTGTFMPAYGLNRMFSNVPLLGNLLGNGRDRGLIGITFKVDGKAKNPRIIVNPLSVIAPGVFRQIFEFH